jgi:hypothetical protein
MNTIQETNTSTNSTLEEVEELIPVNLKLPLVDFIEMQFRWALGKEARKMSKGQLSVLSIFYIHRDVKEAKRKIIDEGLRTNLKSVDNDITFFKDLDFIDVHEGKIIFKGKGGAAKTDKTFLVKVKVV